MTIEKPEIKSQTGLSKAFTELVLKTLPIHRWEQEQKKKRAKMKL